VRVWRPRDWRRVSVSRGRRESRCRDARVSRALRRACDLREEIRLVRPDLRRSIGPMQKIVRKLPDEAILRLYKHS